MNLLDATFLILAGLLVPSVFWLTRRAKRSRGRDATTDNCVPATGDAAFDCGSADGVGCGGGD